MFISSSNTLFAVPPGTVISNTAVANYDVSATPQTRNSNTVDVTTSIIFSDATLEILQFSPNGDGLNGDVSPTGCSVGNTGTFTPLPNPTYPLVGTIDISNPVNLLPAPSISSGNPIFIKVTDANRNFDINIPDLLVINISSDATNDREVIELMETGNNTGEFVGFIQTVETPIAIFDCQFAVESGDTITIDYIDAFDVTDAASERVLIDPFGIVFSSDNGAPVSGLTITLIDAITGLPATVFSDPAGTISYPSTMVTGNDVTDGSGATFTFAAGEYRFPFVAAGTYRLEVTADDFVIPSTVSIATLQTLPNAPFSLDANASFGLDFPLVVGPPLHVDIPIDPISDVLFVSKQASKDVVGIGDFLQYQITVTNNNSSNSAIDVNLLDSLPTGFRYQKDSLQFDSVKQADPNIANNGTSITIALGDIPSGETVTVKYVVEVSSGTPFGNAINTVFATDSVGFRSRDAQAVVDVQDDLISSKSFLIGTVTEGTCKNENKIDYGSATYHMLTEKVGDKLLNELSISKLPNLDYPIEVNFNLPDGLSYVPDSSELNNKKISEPIIQSGSLKYILGSDTQLDSIRLTFSTKVSNEKTGQYVIEAYLKVSESEAKFESHYDIINTIYTFNSSSDSESKKLFVKKSKAKGRVKFVGIPTMKGVEGIRLVLEDGRYVLTDQRGMYHFEGLEPGTHVIQIDPSSIPNHLEIQECVQNTRTAGSKMSQFADIDAGLLWRSNFYLKEKPPEKGKLHTQIDSVVLNDLVRYTMTLQGIQQPLGNINASVILPSEFKFIQDSIKVNGKSGYEARNLFGTLNISLGVPQTSDWTYVLELSAKMPSLANGEYKTEFLLTYDHEGNLNSQSPVIENTIIIDGDDKFVRNTNNKSEQELLNKHELIGDYVHPRESLPVAEEAEFTVTWLNQQDDSLQWLSPRDNYNPFINAIQIEIKRAVNTKLKLELNGKEVSALNFDSRTTSSDKKKLIDRWKGVDLVEGDNVFVATTYSEDDIQLEQVTQTIHYSGQPIKAQLVPEYSRLIADGKNPIVLAVKFFDKWGYPARPEIIGEYGLSQGYTSLQETRELDKQPLNGLTSSRLTYKVEQDGIAFIDIEPSTLGGKLTLDFLFIDDREESIDAWIQAVQKEWILVGLAEGSTGYNNVSGNARALSDNNIEEDFYEDGRLAFYAKGQVKGEWLLTLAYDSERGDDERDDRLFQTIAPDEYYTLYGDATEQQFDAASSDKLYVRLEKNQFYTLFGDFNTDMDVTELSRYTRSLTGAKAEYEGNRFGFNAFASETDQRFVQDEIQGNGTSGLYQLSNNDIVINSEQVSIVTRDRFQPNIIISDVQLTQFVDYTIDTNNGTIFFKQPIPSRDQNFNPVFIVADYEVENSGDKELTAGIRAALYDKERGIEVGISAITQGDEDADGDLIGADFEYNVSEQTQVRLEAARSSVDTGDGDENNDALLAEVEHRTEKINTLVYYRRQDEGFGLDQQSQNNDGAERYGADLRYRVNESVEVNGQAFRDEVLSDNNKRTVADVELNYNKNGYGLAAGLAYAKDELSQQEDRESVLVTAGAAKRLMDNRLNLRANAEIDVNSDNSVDYPTRYIAGADYKLNEISELFTEHEYTQGEDQDTNTTRIGTRLIPWSQAEINTSVEQQSGENGKRLFSNLGLTQGWQYNDHLSLDVSVDRLDTLNDEGVTPFNDNVPLSSGSVSGDFTALSLGANYVQTNWSAASRMEYRTSDTDIQRGVLFGLYSEEFTGLGMSFDTQIFETDTKGGGNNVTADATYALAFRPDHSPYTILNRLEFSFSEDVSDSLDIRSRSLINNLNLNYTVDDLHQLGIHWGAKYVLDDIDGDEFDGFTQLLGFRYRYDIHRRVDLSFQTSILNSSNSENFRYSFGPSVGVNVYQNVWVSLGYNFDGFEDDDFSGAEYTADGPFAKLRIKFDTNTMRSLLNSYK
ncbi:MAG: hypothetical protein AAGB35_01060 [Pseudomonadota bacterium]